MTREERLQLLKQIEKDIHVCSIESTFLDDAKSCAIHSVIEELEQEPTDKKFTKADIDAIIKAINKGWELRVNEVFDKIRAEISTVYESLDGYDPDSLGTFVSKIDEIFDKYKAESEET